MINKVSSLIEERLNRKDLTGAFDIFKYWYEKFTSIAPKLSPIYLEKTRGTHIHLFILDEFEEDFDVDFEYDGIEVNYEIPDEEEIRAVLFKMRIRKAPGIT